MRRHSGFHREPTLIEKMSGGAIALLIVAVAARMLLERLFG